MPKGKDSSYNTKAVTVKGFTGSLGTKNIHPVANPTKSSVTGNPKKGKK